MMTLATIAVAALAFVLVVSLIGIRIARESTRNKRLTADKARELRNWARAADRIAGNG